MARRLGGTLAVVAALCALGPTVSSAGAATTVSDFRDQRFGDAFLTITGDDQGNDIGVEIEAAGEAFIVSDSRPIEIGGFGSCVHLIPNQVRCELPPEDTGVDIDARGGADNVRLERSVAGTIVTGGGGRDTLIGGDGDDVIVGNKGKDVERGRRGADAIGIRSEEFGGSARGRDPGTDTLFGGRGNDALRADDHERDKQLRCGKGHDVVIKDVALDPRPNSCELIERRP